MNQEYSYQYDLTDIRTRARKLREAEAFMASLPDEDKSLVLDMASENGNTEYPDAKIAGLGWIETKAAMFARHPERYTAKPETRDLMLHCSNENCGYTFPEAEAVKDIHGAVGKPVEVLLCPQCRRPADRSKDIDMAEELAETDGLPDDADISPDLAKLAEMMPNTYWLQTMDGQDAEFLFRLTRNEAAGSSKDQAERLDRIFKQYEAMLIAEAAKESEHEAVRLASKIAMAMMSESGLTGAQILRGMSEQFQAYSDFLAQMAETDQDAHYVRTDILKVSEELARLADETEQIEARTDRVNV